MRKPIRRQSAASQTVTPPPRGLAVPELRIAIVNQIVTSANIRIGEGKSKFFLQFVVPEYIRRSQIYEKSNPFRKLVVYFAVDNLLRLRMRGVFRDMFMDDTVFRVDPRRDDRLVGGGGCVVARVGRAEPRFSDG